MDYSRTSNDWSIPGRGDAWFAVSCVEDFDAAMDRMILAVWADGSADEPAETFGVNRNGPGWELLRRAVFGSQDDMAAAYRWWTGIRDTPLVAAYRVLDAVGNVHRCSPQSLAEQLRVPAEQVEPAGRYGQILEALMELRLVGLYLADCTFGLTREGQRTLQPATATSVDQRWLQEALASKLEQISPPPRPGQPAFPRPWAASAPPARAGTGPSSGHRPGQRRQQGR